MSNCVNQSLLGQEVSRRESYVLYCGSIKRRNANHIFFFFFCRGGGGGGGKASFVWGHIREFSTAFHSFHPGMFMLQ